MIIYYALAYMLGFISAALVLAGVAVTYYRHMTRRNSARHSLDTTLYPPEWRYTTNGTNDTYRS